MVWFTFEPLNKVVCNVVSILEESVVAVKVKLLFVENVARVHCIEQVSL
jgi:hypothetical protein